MSTPGSHAFPVSAPSPIALRDLLPSDARLLEWHGGEDLRAWYDEQWRAHQANEIHVLIAACDWENRPDFPVGQAALHWNGKPTHPQIPDIQSLRVHPDFRGLGIGSRLVAACEEYSRARGHAQISLSVELDNIAAKRLYERLGYQVVGAPYCDVWFYADATGKTVRMEATVLDMVKTIVMSNG